jgi:Sec7-like guanine-nucleotide exchange factor
MDRVFIKTQLLDNATILEFIEALCRVSKGELPRTFSLQKLVEVSDHNMDRIAMIWSRMWVLVRDHFVDVCTR